MASLCKSVIMTLLSFFFFVFDKFMLIISSISKNTRLQINLMNTTQNSKKKHTVAICRVRSLSPQIKEAFKNVPLI